MLTERQNEIIVGSLLGDGTIWTNFVEPKMKWQLSQSKFDWEKKDKQSYICWYIKEFLELGVSVKSSVVKASGLVKEISGDKEYQKYVIFTRCNQIWNNIEKQWYVPRTDHKWYKRRKIVPKDIKLTPLTLCVWHMDDGSVNPKDANIELNTQGFTTEEVDFLIERLEKDLGIKSHKKKAKTKNQYKIYIGRKHYFDFIDMIKPHIEWDCLQYKIDAETYDKIPHRGEDHSNSKITENKVKMIFEMRDSGKLQKEIAKKIGVSKAAISQILSGDRWQHLGMSRPTKKKHRLTKEKKVQILQLKDQDNSQKEIAEQLNINQSTVSRVLKGI